MKDVTRRRDRWKKKFWWWDFDVTLSLVFSGTWFDTSLDDGKKMFAWLSLVERAKIADEFLICFFGFGYFWSLCCCCWKSFRYTRIPKKFIRCCQFKFWVKSTAVLKFGLFYFRPFCINPLYFGPFYLGLFHFGSLDLDPVQFGTLSLYSDLFYSGPFDCRPWNVGKFELGLCGLGLGVFHDWRLGVSGAGTVCSEIVCLSRGGGGGSIFCSCRFSFFFLHFWKTIHFLKKKNCCFIFFVIFCF